VGGMRLAALELLLVRAELENRAPAARAGIAGAGTVGVDDHVRLAHAASTSAEEVLSREACSGALPLPEGEGWGEGVTGRDSSVTPSPHPSPLRGEGADRARCSSGGLISRSHNRARS